jgi:hypothetical protein
MGEYLSLIKIIIILKVELTELLLFLSLLIHTTDTLL